MKKNLFKKVIVVLATLIMVFGFAACGGGGGDNYVTPEKYLELRDADWPNMEQAEMEERITNNVLQRFSVKADTKEAVNEIHSLKKALDELLK